MDKDLQELYQLYKEAGNSETYDEFAEAKGLMGDDAFFNFVDSQISEVKKKEIINPESLINPPSIQETNQMISDQNLNQRFPELKQIQESMPLDSSNPEILSGSEQSLTAPTLAESGSTFPNLPSTPTNTLNNPQNTIQPQVTPELPNVPGNTSVPLNQPLPNLSTAPDTGTEEAPQSINPNFKQFDTTTPFKKGRMVDDKGNLGDKISNKYFGLTQVDGNFNSNITSPTGGTITKSLGNEVEGVFEDKTGKLLVSIDGGLYDYDEYINPDNRFVPSESNEYFTKNGFALTKSQEDSDKPKESNRPKTYDIDIVSSGNNDGKDIYGNPISKDSELEIYKGWQNKGYGKILPKEYNGRPQFEINESSKGTIKALLGIDDPDAYDYLKASQDITNPVIQGAKIEKEAADRFIEKYGKNFYDTYGLLPDSEVQQVKDGLQKQQLINQGYTEEQANELVSNQRTGRLQTATNQALNIVNSIIKPQLDERNKGVGLSDEEIKEREGSEHYEAFLKMARQYPEEFIDFYSKNKDWDFSKLINSTSYKNSFFEYLNEDKSYQYVLVDNKIAQSNLSIKKAAEQSDSDAVDNNRSNLNKYYTQKNEEAQYLGNAAQFKNDLQPLFKKEQDDIQYFRKLEAGYRSNDAGALAEYNIRRIGDIPYRFIGDWVGSAASLLGASDSTLNEIKGESRIFTNVFGVRDQNVLDKVIEYSDSKGNKLELVNGRDLFRLDSRGNRTVAVNDTDVSTYITKNNLKKEKEYNDFNGANFTAEVAKITTDMAASGALGKVAGTGLVQLATRLKSGLSEANYARKGLTLLAEYASNPATTTSYAMAAQYYGGSYENYRSKGYTPGESKAMAAFSTLMLANVNRIFPDIRLFEEADEIALNAYKLIAAGQSNEAKKLIIGKLYEPIKRLGGHIAGEISEESVLEPLGEYVVQNMGAIASGDKNKRNNIDSPFDFSTETVSLTVGTVLLAGVLGSRGGSIDFQNTTPLQRSIFLHNNPEYIKTLNNLKGDPILGTSAERELNALNTINKYLNQIPSTTNLTIQQTADVVTRLQQRDQLQKEYNSNNAEASKRVLSTQIANLDNEIESLLTQPAQESVQEEAPIPTETNEETTPTVQTPETAQGQTTEAVIQPAQTENTESAEPTTAESSVNNKVFDTSHFTNPDNAYRIVVGDEAFNDILDSGRVRTNSKNKNIQKGEGLIDVTNRPTLFPSFSKGKISEEYANNNDNHYIIETSDPSIQPSTSRRHGRGTTYFPTDRETGKHLESLDANKVNVYQHIGNGQYRLVLNNNANQEQNNPEAVSENQNTRPDSQYSVNQIIEEQRQNEIDALPLLPLNINNDPEIQKRIDQRESDIAEINKKYDTKIAQAPRIRFNGIDYVTTYTDNNGREKLISERTEEAVLNKYDELKAKDSQENLTENNTENLVNEEPKTEKQPIVQDKKLLDYLDNKLKIPKNLLNALPKDLSITYKLLMGDKSMSLMERVRQTKLAAASTHLDGLEISKEDGTITAEILGDIQVNLTATLLYYLKGSNRRNSDIFHEVVHAGTLITMKDMELYQKSPKYRKTNKYTPEQIEAYENIRFNAGYYNDLYKEGRKKRSLGVSTYGLSNEYEFIAEFMSNPKFKQWLLDTSNDVELRKRQQKKGNLKGGILRNIWDDIKILLGIKNKKIDTELEAEINRDIDIILEAQRNNLDNNVKYQSENERKEKQTENNDEQFQPVSTESNQQSENTPGTTPETSVQSDQEEQVISNTNLSSLLSLQNAQTQRNDTLNNGDIGSQPDIVQQNQRTRPEDQQGTSQTPVSRGSETNAQITEYQSQNGRYTITETVNENGNSYELTGNRSGKKVNLSSKQKENYVAEIINSKQFPNTEIDFSEGMTPDEVSNEIINNSENPNELAQLILTTPKYNSNDVVGSKDWAIAQIIGANNISRESYARFGDINNIGYSIARTYFAKKGQGKSIDIIAQEASEFFNKSNDQFDSITPEDIVKFINDYPNDPSKAERPDNPIYQKAVDNFIRITGMNPTKSFISKILKVNETESTLSTEKAERQYDLLSTEEKNNLHNEYEEWYNSLTLHQQTEEDVKNYQEDAFRGSIQNDSEIESNEAIEPQERSKNVANQRTATNSPEYQQLLRDRSSKESEVKSAKENLDRISREVNRNFSQDQEDLFGERASQNETQLFDERADAQAGRNTLNEAQTKYNTARQELSEINNRIRSFESGDNSGTGQLALQQSSGNYNSITPQAFDALITRLKKVFSKAFNNLTVTTDWNTFLDKAKSLGLNVNFDVNFNINPDSRKEKQLALINKTNPAPNDYNTWVRSTDDILTAEEAFQEAFSDGEMYPDFTIEDMRNAIDSGEITIYSSFPIKEGVFVTPSKMNAESYSGNGKVYSKKVKTTDLAWIDQGEGQYAPVQFMHTSGGDIYGAKLPDGTIYINPDLLNANTPIHEFSHLWEQLMPNAWKKGVELFKQTRLGKELFNKLKNEGNYSHLTDTELWSEAMNTHIGNIGEERYQNPRGKMAQFVQWLKDIFARIGERTGINKLLGRSLTPEDQFRTFSENVIGDLLGNRAITPEGSSENRAVGFSLGDMNLTKIAENVKKHLKEYGSFLKNKEKLRKGELTNPNTIRIVEESRFNDKNYSIELGTPSNLLQQLGIPNSDMSVSIEYLNNKIINQDRHDISSMTSFRNIVEGIHNPIAVFDNYEAGKRTENRFELLTSLKNADGKNIAIILNTEAGNTIKTGFALDTINRLRANLFNNNGNGTKYLNKQQLVDVLKTYATSSVDFTLKYDKANDQIRLSAKNTNSNSLKYIKETVDLINNFQNPTIEGKNIQFSINPSSLIPAKTVQEVISEIEKNGVQSGLDKLKQSNWYNNLSDGRKKQITDDNLFTVDNLLTTLIKTEQSRQQLIKERAKDKLEKTKDAKDAEIKDIKNTFRNKISEMKRDYKDLKAKFDKISNAKQRLGEKIFWRKQASNSIKLLLRSRTLKDKITPNETATLLGKADRIMNARDINKAFDDFQFTLESIVDKAEKRGNNKKLSEEKKFAKYNEVKDQVEQLINQGKSLDEIRNHNTSSEWENYAEKAYYRIKSTTISPEDASKAVTELNNKEYEMINPKVPLLQRFRKWRASLSKNTFDRQWLPKKYLNAIGARNTENRLVNLAGAASRGKLVFEKAYESIFKGLTKKERSYLDNVIQQRRIIAIDENREARNLIPVDHSKNMDKNTAKAYLEDVKRSVGQEKYNDLVKRADQYFTDFNNLLSEMKKEGLINQEAYDSMNGLDYQPRVFLEHLLDYEDNLSPEEKAFRSETGGLSKEIIRSLDEGSTGVLLSNAELLLATAIGSRYRAIMMNRVNKEFINEEFPKAKRDFENLDPNKVTEYEDNISKNRAAKSKEERFYRYFKELDKKIIDNPIIGTNANGKPVYQLDKTPQGYKKAYYFENGVRNEFFMEEELHQMWHDTNKGIDADLKNKIGALSGSHLIKAFATGYNPAFVIVNTPRDFLHAINFSNEYSTFIPLAVAQLSKDTAVALREIYRHNRGNDTLLTKYIEYGGGMDFLNTQGMLKDNSWQDRVVNNIVEPKQKELIQTILKYVSLKNISNYSEVGFRVAVFKRAIDNEIKEIQKKNPNVKSISDLPQNEQDYVYDNAVRQARDLMDFNQGGIWAKNAEAIIPYFNAGVQGTRVVMQQFKRKPYETTMKVLQTSVMGVSAIIGIGMVAMSKIRDDEDDDESTTLKYLDFLETLSPYQKANFFNIPTGYDKEKKTYTMLSIAKSQGLTPMFTLTEDLIENTMRASENKKQKDWTTIYKNVGFAFNNNVDPTGFSGIFTSGEGVRDIPEAGGKIIAKNPAIKSMLTYLTGYDFFFEQPLQGTTNNTVHKFEGANSSKVEEFYKQLGLKSGLSPVRTKAMVESFVTSPTTNPFVGMMYGGLDVLTTDKTLKDGVLGYAGFDEKGKYKLNKIPVINRALRETTEYSRQLNIAKEVKTTDAFQEALEKEELMKNLSDKIAKRYETIQDAAKDRKRIVNDILDFTKDQNMQEKMAKRIESKLSNKNVDGRVWDVAYSTGTSNQAKAILIYSYFGDVRGNIKIQKDLKQARVWSKPIQLEYVKLLNKK